MYKLSAELYECLETWTHQHVQVTLKVHLEVCFFQLTSICTSTYATLVVELKDKGDRHDSIL